ncbi:MAG: hypothetical protein FD181_3657 [Prolixibacteraceae bacterium]|nr:MAG: hypothetical protein FD181_3657 [Prolixibacteraceae bacterium]
MYPGLDLFFKELKKIFFRTSVPWLSLPHRFHDSAVNCKANSGNI